jgi:peptide chain release factor
MVFAGSSMVHLNDVIFESCRASGAGGQHVNKTESAVRALHTPTGLRVRVESERSQYQNKQRALAAIANALAAQQSRQAARAQSERRHRALHVERGRPIASWHTSDGSLVRSD